MLEKYCILYVPKAESEAFVFIYVYCLFSSKSAIGEAVDEAIATATPTAIFVEKTRRSNRAIATSNFEKVDVAVATSTLPHS